MIPALVKNKANDQFSDEKKPLMEEDPNLGGIVIPDGEETKAKDEESSATIFMTEDQKIMAEPWIEVFGKDPITKLFSKKFSEKERGL